MTHICMALATALTGFTRATDGTCSYDEAQGLGGAAAAARSRDEAFSHLGHWALKKGGEQRSLGHWVLGHLSLGSLGSEKARGSFG